MRVVVNFEFPSMKKLPSGAVSGIHPRGDFWPVGDILPYLSPRSLFGTWIGHHNVQHRNVTVSASDKDDPIIGFCPGVIGNPGYEHVQQVTNRAPGEIQYDAGLLFRLDSIYPDWNVRFF